MLNDIKKACYKRLRNIGRCNVVTAMLGGTLLAVSILAQAAELQITMEYKPTPGQPLLREFKNTTPTSGFCAQNANLCYTGDFSILIPGLKAKTYFDSASDEAKYNRVSSTFDSRKKKVVLTEKKTGNTFETDFRWAFFGVQYNNSNPLLSISYAMAGTGFYPVGGCSGRTGVGNARFYRYGWGLPESIVTCYSPLKKVNPPFQDEVSISSISLGYTVTTPNPLQMIAGTYEGEIRYTIGSGADVDLNAYDYTDNEVVIKITAIVEHAFYLYFAPGSEHVQLSPPEGWPRYINGGPVPNSLKKEVPFILTSSRPFKVRMTCEYREGTGCGLRHTASNQQVPLEVGITLPGFRTSGQSIRNYVLDTNEEGLLIQSDSYIINRRSSLDFKVKRSGVETMVSQPGSTWQGNVTIIFDADF